MSKTDDFLKIILRHRDFVIGDCVAPRPTSNEEDTACVNSYHAAVREVAKSELADVLLPLLKRVKEHYDEMIEEARERVGKGLLAGAFSLDSTHKMNHSINELLDELPRLRAEQSIKVSPKVDDADNIKEFVEQRLFTLLTTSLREGRSEIISMSKRRLADLIGCSPAAVSKSSTWKMIMNLREQDKSISMTPTRMLDIVEEVSELGNFGRSSDR